MEIKYKCGDYDGEVESVYNQIPHGYGTLRYTNGKDKENSRKAINVLLANSKIID